MEFTIQHVWTGLFLLVLLSHALRRRRIPLFWSITIFVVVTYYLLDLGIPYLSRKATGLTLPLPIPGTLKTIYLALILIGAFVQITFREENFQEFLRPLLNLFRGVRGLPLIDRAGNSSRGGVIYRAFCWIIVILVPFFSGFGVYSSAIPQMISPTTLRIQHPSSNFPKANENLKNPFRELSEEAIQPFIDEVKRGEVDFLVDDPTGIVKELIEEVKGGKVDPQKAKEALIRKYLFEGRVLYQINCRPCHGTLADGDGPMTRGFRLRPINFTDDGTIETIVEGYTFWRVKEGGLGLPLESSPWDSAMPVWKPDLTDEEIWKIIFAEYETAGKDPRMPEK